jgi:lysophospholipase L1-like esterase
MESYEDLPSPPRFPLDAVSRLAQMLTVVILASLVPYAVPSLAEFRYWDRLDGTPIAMALRMEAPVPPVKVPDETAEKPPQLASAQAEDEAEAEADAEAAKLVPKDLMPEPTVAQPEPELAGGAPEKIALPVEKPLASDKLLHVSDDQLGDQKVWCEGNPHALDGFFQALVDMVNGKRQYVHIAHYGDSHTANDGITDITRKMLQRRFGDGGHGFSLVHARTNWYKHRGIKRTASEGWKITNFLNGNGPDGAYGFGGVAVEGGPGEMFGLDSQGHHVSHAMLYYHSEGRATVSVKVDGKPAETLQINDAVGTDAWHDWKLPLGPHAIVWKITAGRVRLFGGALETDRGVVYDSLGEVGARGTRWLNANEAHLRTVLQQRSPDLVILNYGGNERIDKVTEAQYLERMGKVVNRFVLVPEKNGQPQPARSCLLIGPGDHGTRKGGKVVSDPDIIRIIDWQRKLAKQTGCAFWDSRALMGGEGAMGRWVAGGLGWSDYAHFSPKGEAVMGVATYRALLHSMRSAVPNLTRQPGTTLASVAPVAPPAQVAPAECKPAKKELVGDDKSAHAKGKPHGKQKHVKKHKAKKKPKKH